MKFSLDGESEIIRVADSEIVPVGTVKLPPQDGGSDEEWQPQGLRKGNTLPPGERENFLPAVFIVVRGKSCWFHPVNRENNLSDEGWDRM